MRMKALTFTLVVGVLLAFSQRTHAQQAKKSDEIPKYEVGIDFTSLTLNESQTHPGAGGRFTYNWDRHIALEAAGYFSPGKCASCEGEFTGHITEGLFGVKAGQRFKRFGIFGKVRPGFLRFSQGFFDLVPTGGTGPFPATVVVRSRTDFATDVGGVLEIYSTRRCFFRFDAGVLFDRIGSRTFHSFTVDPVTGALSPIQFTAPSFTRRRFQFIAGVGFRF